jgi:arylsulfatase A-like enzyme
MVFELPDSMTAGRSALDLSFPAGSGLLVRAAALSESLPPGEVSLSEDSIAQQGWSALDFVQRIEPHTRLTGRLEPPLEPQPGQRFSLEIHRPGQGLETVFQWTPASTLDNRIEVELGPIGGLIRFRLLAEGVGDSGRWEGLRLAWRRSPPEEVPTPEAPRIVVLYVLDALRADHLGAFGDPRWPTPVLDRIASEGVALVSHMSNAPNTKPSLKSLFSGRSVLVDGNRKMPDASVTTLAEAFLGAGYRTAAISGSPWVSGAFGTAQGFQFRSRRARHRPRPPNRNASRVHAEALRWLDGLAERERAFLYLHTMHPHNPYDPPGTIKDEYASGIDSRIEGSTETLLEIRKGRRDTTGTDRERLRALYAAGLAYNDRELAGFMDELRRRFAPGEALVVLTSDHGEELFDHRGVLHGYTLYEDQLHVPLIFWWPGRLAPAQVDSGSDHLDLHATLRSLIEPELPDDVEGRQLWKELAGRTDVAGRVRFAAASSLDGGIFMARSERYKLIWAPRVGGRWGMGDGPGRAFEPELVFDLEHDPGEQINLAGEPILEVAWLRSRMMAWIERGRRDDSGEGEPEEIDAATRAELEALGYLD